ncbi:MAG: zf-HC2 domain-containing protein [Planctomycetes bacterium]|nr:zf-HC2 domain-containing protein [Planctomycetota bacterium]
MKSSQHHLHQPPNPDDLRRLPPAGPACALVRGLLRDFADGDLDAAERRHVEEHVHACFACAVELSRAEHEVLQLRRGFAAIASEEAQRWFRLPRDFAGRVVERLLADRRAAEDTAQVGDLLAPACGAQGIAVRRSRALGLLVAALLLLACLGGMAVWTLERQGGPDQAARLVVIGAHGARDDHGRRLRVGDGLGEAQGLKIGAGGSVVVDWHDWTSGKQPAATLEVRGAGSVRLQNGVPLLLDGAIGIETNRPVEIPLADGSAIHLGLGDYLIVAEVGQAEEDYRNQATDPMGGAPADLRVRVEVLRGDPARILRGEVGPTLVAAGSVGIYAGNSGVAVFPGGVQLAGGEIGRSAGPAEATGPSVPTLLAAAHQRSGLPSVGTQVAAAYLANGVASYRVGVTDAYGAVGIVSEAPWTSDYAVLHALPAQLSYGILAPDVYPLLREGANVRVPQSLVLDLAEPLHGMVVDDFDLPRGGVRVVPCIVDELFGDVFPLLNHGGISDELGRFQILRLAAGLPAYQHLALLLVHPQLETTVVPVPVRSGANAMLPMPVIRMRSLRGTLLYLLPPNTTVTVWEDVRTMAGRVVCQHQFQSDGIGRVPVAKVGRGDLWFLVGSPANPLVCRMELDQAGPEPRYRPGLPAPRSAFFRPMDPIAGTNVLIAGSFRHQRLEATPPGNPVAGFVMVARDALGRTVGNAQAFAVTPTGPRGQAEARFLGLTSAQGAISLEAIRYAGDLVVLGSDGMLQLIAGPQQSIPRLDARLAPPGRVVLGPGLRPGANEEALVGLTFRRQAQDLPGLDLVVDRFASEATGWEFPGLPPGLYSVHVQGMERLVLVPEDGVAILE